MTSEEITSATNSGDVGLEIGHVLFMDIVGYSKLLTNEQRERLQELNGIVRETDQFRAAEAAGKLLRLPTGDGMVLAFFTTPDAPVRCALAVGRALKGIEDLPLRMGVHSGPVDHISDVNGRSNLAGAGVNIAQRVMDCGDAGHILLSRRLADDLSQYGEWQSQLHDLGEVEVKHGVKIAIANLVGNGAGNPSVPKKLAAVRKSRAVRRRRHKVLWAAGLLFTIGLLTAGYWIQKARVARTAAATSLPMDKSIAVLPFENLSAEKEDAFFADGIQDDVLTSVGKIKELTVIARGSVLPYRGEAAVAGKLREIGRTLRVAHILQGSVRRLGQRVVVNVQLIDARNDRQVWAQRYERTMVDALSLQGELAVEIARELHASLTPLEQRLVAARPTENPDAYLLYLRARELEINPLASRADYEAAAALYQRAIDLDPKFALARARLSSRVITLHHKSESAQMQKGLAEAEEALRLQPSLGEARLALANYYLRVPADFERALAELVRAGELIPNSSEVWNLRGQIYKRQGRIRERIAALQQAEILDPRDANNILLLMQTFASIRDWAEATRAAERWQAFLPEAKRGPWLPAFYESRLRGETAPSLRAATGNNPAGNPPRDPNHLIVARYLIAMIDRDYAAAERYLRETTEPTIAAAHSKSMHEGLLAVARGADPAVAEHALVVARQEVEKRLTEDATAATNHRIFIELGLIDAFRGRKEDALRHGRRATELANNSVLEKNDALAALALIYARTGEPGEAIKLIEHLLTVPANFFGGTFYQIAHLDLKMHWVWDPLRSDPRFQKILAEPEPKTIY